MTADKIVNIALAEVGTKESPAGSNRTKYGEAYGWNGVPWCVQFCWWCFKQAGASGLFYGGGKTASCGQLRSYAKEHGQWVTGGYRRGDLAIFDFANTGVETDHIGIITDVTSTGVVTIEGNTSATGSQSNGGMVMQKTRAISLINGAYRPKYTEEEDTMTGKEIYEALSKYLSEQEMPAWAEDEFKQAVNAGITDGTNPMQMIPRYQAAIMALRASGKGVKA